MVNQYKRTVVVAVAAVLCFACNPQREAHKQELRQVSCPVVDIDSIVRVHSGNDFAFSIDYGTAPAAEVRILRVHDTVYIPGRIVVRYRYKEHKRKIRKYDKRTGRSDLANAWHSG